MKFLDVLGKLRELRFWVQGRSLWNQGHKHESHRITMIDGDPRNQGLGSRFEEKGFWLMVYYGFEFQE